MQRAQTERGTQWLKLLPLSGHAPCPQPWGRERPALIGTRNRPVCFGWKDGAVGRGQWGVWIRVVYRWKYQTVSLGCFIQIYLSRYMSSLFPDSLSQPMSGSFGGRHRQ